MPPEPPDPAAEAKNRAMQLKKEKLLAVKDCAVVLDDEDREWCFELHDEREEALKVCDLIVDEENEKLCRKDVLGKAYKEDPYLEDAKDKCDAIEDEDKKLTCIEEVNENTLDEEAIEKCNLIIDDSQRDVLTGLLDWNAAVEAYGITGDDADIYENGCGYTFFITCWDDTEIGAITNELSIPQNAAFNPFVITINGVEYRGVVSKNCEFPSGTSPYTVNLN